MGEQPRVWQRVPLLPGDIPGDCAQGAYQPLLLGALQFRKDAKACRELFFSQDLPEPDLLR